MSILYKMVDGVRVLMSDAEEAEFEASRVQGPPAVPRVVTMRQARLALFAAGLLASVEEAIDAMPSPQKEAARIEWEYSQEVHRDKALVLALAPALGLNEQQLDALFIDAAAR